MRLRFLPTLPFFFLTLLPACGRDSTTPRPPGTPAAAETRVPAVAASTCTLSPAASLSPPDRAGMGGPPPGARPPRRPVLPGRPHAKDLEDPAPGIPAGGSPEDVPRAGDFPAPATDVPGAATFFWMGLTPCNRILPGTRVPADAAEARGAVSVQTVPGATLVRLIFQVTGLPASLTTTRPGSPDRPTAYRPWLAARAIDGRYLFVPLPPFTVTAATEQVVRVVTDPVLDAAEKAGVPVEITSDGLRAGKPLSGADMAFPLLQFRFVFITAGEPGRTSSSLRPDANIVLSGVAPFPVPRLRTVPAGKR
jgi:hypothetical protein